jgi:hypothetical protein
LGNGPFKIPAEDEPSAGMILKTTEQYVSVSLKYWHSGSECLSGWQRTELTKLRKLIDKVQSLSPAEIRNDPGLHWKLHKAPAARGFSRPQALSKDIQLCELRVDGKSRIHGVLLESIFYLVWLDRSHGVFPGQ